MEILDAFAMRNQLSRSYMYIFLSHIRVHIDGIQFFLRMVKIDGILIEL